jgi:hypothetical protein
MSHLGNWAVLLEATPLTISSKEKTSNELNLSVRREDTSLQHASTSVPDNELIADTFKIGGINSLKLEVELLDQSSKKHVYLSPGETTTLARETVPTNL